MARLRFQSMLKERLASRLMRLAIAGSFLCASGSPAFAEEIDAGRAPLARLAGVAVLMAVILVALLFKTGLVGAASLAQRLRPALPAAAGARLAARPFAMFMLGLLDTALLIVALAFFKLSNDLRLLLLAAALPPLAVGLAGLYGLVGDRDGTDDRAKAILRGGILIETATLIPLAGQFFQAIILIASFGAGVLTLISARYAAPAAAPQPPPAINERPASE